MWCKQVCYVFKNYSWLFRKVRTICFHNCKVVQNEIMVKKKKAGNFVR